MEGLAPASHGEILYLDLPATTPVDPRVVDVMRPLLEARFGNPHSDHAHGTAPAEAVALAAEQIADLLNADPGEIVFTSGATESNNAAIKGVMLSPDRRGDHVVVACDSINRGGSTNDRCSAQPSSSTAARDGRGRRRASRDWEQCAEASARVDAVGRTGCTMTDHLTLQSQRDLYAPRSERGRRSCVGILTFAFMKYRFQNSENNLSTIRCWPDEQIFSHQRNMQ